MSRTFRIDLNAHINTAIEAMGAGMDRKFGEFIPIKEPSLNLGSGEKKFSWATPLQLPEWDGEHNKIPRSDESMESIVAFHFFEHLTPARLPFILSECARVLRSGGTLTSVVPHRLGAIAFQDPDHKAFFTEDTWRTLMSNTYYKTKASGLSIPLNINMNIIFGESEKNLCLFTQFVRA